MQNLVSGVVGGEPELAGPAAYFPPAEPGVEVFESRSPAGREVELLEAHLVPGDLPEPVHQGRSDALVAVSGLGLQVVDGSPVGAERQRRSRLRRDPSCERAVHCGRAGSGFAAGSRLAARVSTAGATWLASDRGKRETRGARQAFEPAIQHAVSSCLTAGPSVARSRELDDVQVVAGGHGPTVSRTSGSRPL